LEKVILATIMVMVLIYTLIVDRNPSKSDQKTHVPRPSSENQKSFFPKSNPNPEDESIVEETFTEVP
jgi:hypothetical protein